MSESGGGLEDASLSDSPATADIADTPGVPAEAGDTNNGDNAADAAEPADAEEQHVGSPVGDAPESLPQAAEEAAAPEGQVAPPEGGLDGSSLPVEDEPSPAQAQPQPAPADPSLEPSHPILQADGDAAVTSEPGAALPPTDEGGSAFGTDAAGGEGAADDEGAPAGMGVAGGEGAAIGEDAGGGGVAAGEEGAAGGEDAADAAGAAGAEGAASGEGAANGEDAPVGKGTAGGEDAAGASKLAQPLASEAERPTGPKGDVDDALVSSEAAVDAEAEPVLTHAEGAPADEEGAREQPAEASGAPPSAQQAPETDAGASVAADAAHSAVPSGEAGPTGAPPVQESDVAAAAYPLPVPARDPPGATLHAVMGLDTHRRNNALLVDDDTLVTCIGSHVVFLSLTSGARRYLRGIDGGGVGAVAVHPSRTLLAVGEKARTSGSVGPCVYIYSYPELQCVKVLRGGTERAYSALAFDAHGNTLASVGSFPDFLLTLWDWKAEAIVLRAKAFSQDVYTVAFSPYFEGQLTTSGQGHIRFWRMASTFTGLKLQGAIGKFGNVELSDVAGFVELPDGKVLSTTEGGELLLWDGGLIKVVLTRASGRPCHDGPAEVLLHDRASGVILSAGADGYVRVWDFNQVNDAEPPEDGPYLELRPLDEVLVASGAHLVALAWQGRRWVAVDRSGAVYVVALPASGSISKGAAVECVATYPAGAVAGLALSPQSHVGLSASKDGHLRLLDYRTGATLAKASGSQPITAFAPYPGPSAAVLAAAVTGHRDGVVRVHARCASAVTTSDADPEGAGAPAPSGSLVLTGAAKPHKGAITVLALTRDASRLATCGEDGTVFFFRVLPPDSPPVPHASGVGATGVLAPHAYVRLPQGSGVATCAVWDAPEQVVLVGTSRGTILQVPLPPDSLDTHHSFEWAGALVQSYMVSAPKPKRQKRRKAKQEGGEDAGGAGQAAAEDEGDASNGASAEAQDDAAAEGQGGEEGNDGSGDDAQDEADADAQDDSGPSSSSGELLTLAVAPDQSSLIVTVGGNSFAARKVWRVRLDEPLATPLYEGFASAPVSFFAYSADGGLALMGSADGLVRLQPLDGPYGAPSGPTWESPLHDMQHGRVASIAISFDGAYLLTAAHDGAVHLLSMELFGPVEPKAAFVEDLPSPDALLARTDDVTSASAYTLEEEKQQAERDQQMREAEEKKLSVRERLGRIRSEFEALLSENEGQPEALRLSRADFEVDPGLRELMEAEARKREEVARLELAWESERQRLGLVKLRAYFLDNLEAERVVLYSLRGGSVVTTFRIARLSDEAKAELAALRAAAAASNAAGGDGSGRDAGGADARKGSETGGGPAGDAAARARLAEATAALEEGAASGKLNKADLRRLARKQREAEWTAFNATRPDDTYDSPADLRAIEDAQRTIGDFKLKSDPNFIVPEEERMTPQRKRHAMLELEESLHDTKRAFNQKFFALRDVKRKVLTDIHAKLGALAELAAAHAAGAASSGGVAGSASDTDAAVAAYLAPFSSMPAALLPDERPEEAREAVTDEDLAAFSARKEEEERKAAAAAAGGLGGFATTGAKRPAGPVPPPGGAAAPAGAPAGTAAAGGGGLSASEEALAKMMAAAPQSELEKNLAVYNRRRVEHMRNKLTDEINGLIEAFDDAHNALKAEKLSLEADVKAGEMRLLVALQELQLLREFDKRESVLLQKRQAKLDDKQEIVDKITECTDKLEQKRAELEGLVARRAAVVAELDSVVPESDPFREALVRVFHRRIKRSKKKAGGGDDDYDSDEDEEDDELGDDEADDDDDGGEEVCPPGCDQSVYERVCDLREKRLDEEDMIAEFQKTIEVLRKEKEALAKKQRLVEQGLAAVNADMAEFQKEKQGRLNQVEVVVSLRMHQIEYLLDGCLPDDLSAALVFSAAQLRRLQRRVDELEDEKAALRNAHKDLKREHTALLRDKADKEKKVSELEARAHDVQMLKFGQVIDLELLDRVSSSRGTEDLKEELRKQELRYARELAEWDARISARMDELVALTRENTACLNAVSELTSAQRKLEGGLTATRKGLFTDPVQQRKAEVEERDALVQLVNAQAQEIDRLKSQLLALRRKDTSMFA